ncbi:MAG: hypothetical protein HOG19_05755 [Gammaproteobacteria bacterium]|nr:hypothetical protein [Gammaproteobacteria bacterium]
MRDENGGTLEWKGDGNHSAIMQLTMKIAKLETFVRQLEKDLDGINPEKSRERLGKNESRLDVMDDRLGKIEDSVSSLDDIRAVSKWLNPKAIGSVLAILLGGSVAGNVGISTLQHNGTDQKIEQKIETQDERLDKLLKMLEAENDS